MHLNGNRAKDNPGAAFALSRAAACGKDFARDMGGTVPALFAMVVTRQVFVFLPESSSRRRF
jgi:hypothetical protein